MKPTDILNKISQYNKTLFDISPVEQKRFIESLGIPKDYIDRSYKQFLCQQFFSPKWVKIILFVLSLVLIFPLLLILCFKNRRIKFQHHIEAIAADYKVNEVIPEELLLRYNIKHSEWNAGTGISLNDITFLYKKMGLFRHPYFVLKNLMLIATYSPRITRYAPKAIITHGEYSFSSSLLTEYCHSRGVKHINVMHGEKLYNIRDSFFQFDECYVWSQHYIDLFVSLKAEPSQFKIAVPPSLLIDINAHLNQDRYADYKYYLDEISEDEIKSIIKSMAFVKREGKTVKYRIHPRYTDINVLRKYVPECDIEYPNEVTIYESVSNLEYAVGSYTTVLLQSYLSGKKIILDDMTYEKHFHMLKEYGYILAKENIERLSEKQ